MEELNIQEVAQRIRLLREDCDLTMQEMADATGRTVAEYAAQESGEEDLSFTFLYKCAKKLDVDVIDLLTGETPHLKGYSLVRDGEGVNIKREAEFIYLHKAPRLKNKLAEPFLVTVPYDEALQDKPMHLSYHEGQELDYVLSGHIRFSYENEHFEEVGPGDTDGIDSNGWIVINGGGDGSKESGYVYSHRTGADDISQYFAECHHYDGVVIGDIPSGQRNDLLKYCYSHGIRTYTIPKITDVILKSSETMHIFDTPIFRAVDRIEQNPCYLCARMRRGHLYQHAQSLGCNKIALGHHFSDVIETTVMGMFYGGQLQAMIPKLHSKNFAGMTLIRPLYMVNEEDILAWKRYNDLEFIQCACRFTESCTMCDNGGGGSKRQEIKTLIRRLKRDNPNIEKSIFQSLHNLSLDTFPAFKSEGTEHSFLERFDRTE